ncbi:MAG TPA: alpha/beta fold hydrolase [Myxococcaceae bacterium]|nr:alpha/beta fold hydrolase [Myxococcaceae bacterium]
MLIDVALLVLVVALWMTQSAVRAVRSEGLGFHPPRRSPPPPWGIEVQPASWTVRPPRYETFEVKGWWVPPKNGATVLLTHGSVADRAQVREELLILAGAGFGALAFDWPGHGESGGVVKLGVPERAAFEAAVDWVLKQPGVQPGHLGAFGISNGAALVTAFAAEDPRIAAVAAAGGYTDALDQTSHEYGGTWPWARAAAVAVVRRHLDGGNFRPIDVAAKLKGRKALFITFADDPVVPARMSQELADATGGEVYRIPGEGHATYAEGGGRAYAEKLVQFFSGALVR